MLEGVSKSEKIKTKKKWELKFETVFSETDIFDISESDRTFPNFFLFRPKPVFYFWVSSFPTFLLVVIWKLFDEWQLQCR